MNGTVQAPSTPDALLVWEATQEVRHEFDGVRPVAMTGGTLALPEVGIELPLAEPYIDLDLATPTSPSPAGGRGLG